VKRTATKLLFSQVGLFAMIAIVIGCNKSSTQSGQDYLAQNWSAPVRVTDTKSGFVDAVDLYKFNNTIIMIQVQDGHTARYFVLQRDGNSWAESKLSGVRQGYLWTYPAIDQAGGRVFFDEGYMENNQLVMNVIMGNMDKSISLRNSVEKKWSLDMKQLFGRISNNVRLTEPGKRDWPELAVGLANNSDMYIPYCLSGETYSENTIFDDLGPFNNGVFHSVDSGMTWQMERVSDSAAYLPSIIQTKNSCYYLAASRALKRGQGWELWFARKPVGGNAWDAKKEITKSFCDSALYWKYVSVAADDTIHVCWLDRQHEKTRFSLGDSQRRNYEIVYCHRADADKEWGQQVILSKGLLYSYSPALSVEGNNIVVAWAGVQTAPDRHSEHSPNDIYFVTSKDGGKTWSKMLKATDRAKDGITSGKPQVMLLNGVIHLFYIQGNLNLKQESPGLTKLNQPPWPIYYTQRPFPN
jgi:hypothetical protein